MLGPLLDVLSEAMVAECADGAVGVEVVVGGTGDWMCSRDEEGQKNKVVAGESVPLVALWVAVRVLGVRICLCRYVQAVLEQHKHSLVSVAQVPCQAPSSPVRLLSWGQAPKGSSVPP